MTYLALVDYAFTDNKCLISFEREYEDHLQHAVTCVKLFVLVTATASAASK